MQQHGTVISDLSVDAWCLFVDPSSPFLFAPEAYFNGIYICKPFPTLFQLLWSDVLNKALTLCT